MRVASPCNNGSQEHESTLKSDMDTLQNMRFFLRVAEAGSFTAAAQQMGTTTAQASRAVSDLESHLRTRLLQRTTRRVALTEAGSRYVNRCEQILACVDEAEAEAGNALAHPAGKLKIHAMNSFGQHYVVPMISRYRERYPLVNVELTLSQRMPDLLEEGYDVALLLAPKDLRDSSLISQRLGSACNIACASPGYIARNGLPRSLSDLASHTCLRLVSPGAMTNEWTFDGPDGREVVKLGPSSFTVNVAGAMAVAICEGMGIGVLPTSSALPYLRAGTLLRVFPEYTIQELQIYAVYPSRQYLDAKVRTWVEFARTQLPDTLAADASSMVRFSVPSRRVA
jgi:DNA-binding transcriptional LysR family regulator